MSDFPSFSLKWQRDGRTVYAMEEASGTIPPQNAVRVTSKCNRFFATVYPGPNANGEEVLAIAEAIQALPDTLRRLEEAEKIIRDLIRTGLNGGNNMRLAYLAAKQTALDADDLANAEDSEQAVRRARAFLSAPAQEGAVTP